MKPLKPKPAIISPGELHGGPSMKFPASFCQSGLVLLLSLAILAGLSLLALLAAQSMLQQQHMAANHSDGELARLAAMTAVSAGEKFLFSLPDDSRVEGCQTDCFIEPLRSMMLRSDIATDQAEFLPDDWWLQWGQSLEPAFDESPVSTNPDAPWILPGRHPPLFIIRELEFLAATEPPQETGLPQVSGVAYYQILGRGAGLGSSTTHVVESILARPWLASTQESNQVFSDCGMFRPGLDCGRLAYRERR